MLRSFRYEEIAEDLRRQIRQGKYPHGKRLPSERTLMQHYGVQRNTVRQALNLLQSEGRLQVQPRSGVFALPEPTPSAIITAEDAPPALPITTAGAILVINSWNRASTALDSVLYGLSHSLEGTPLSIQRFNALPKPGTGVHVTPPLEYLTAHNVVGAIWWPQSTTDLGALTQLRDQIPLILIDRRVLGFEADCVRFDDLSGGRIVTEHLIEQGHRRIGFLGDEVFAETVQHRWRGYTLALEDAGIPLDPGCHALFVGITEPHFSDQMRLFLAGAGDPLTAVVCSNDTTALALLRFLRANGYRVPEDIAVTGYGNLLPEYLDTLELTTVAQPFETVGRAAGERLRERLTHNTPAGDYRQIELPVHLIVRNSSQAPPSGRPKPV